MKKLKLSLLISLSLLALFNSCKKDNSDDTPNPIIEEPDKVIEEPIEETEEYEFNISLTYPSYDNPEVQEEATYTFEYKDGAFSEKTRKGTNKVRIKTRAYTGMPTPVSIVTDVEINDISKLTEQISNITFGRKAPSETIQLLDGDLRILPNENKIDMVPNPAIPHQSIQRIHLISNQNATEPISTSETLEIEFRDANSTLGVVDIEIETLAEDINFDVNIDIQKTLNQIADNLSYLAIRTGIEFAEALGFEHVVGGDGCPMPLFEFSAQLNNTMSSEMRKNLCYNFTNLDMVDAINLKYPSDLLSGDVLIENKPYNCYMLNDMNRLQAEFEFNCVRAADFSATPLLNVFYRDDENMPYQVLKSSFNFETKMK